MQSGLLKSNTVLQQPALRANARPSSSRATWRRPLLVRAEQRPTEVIIEAKPVVAEASVSAPSAAAPAATSAVQAAPSNNAGLAIGAVAAAVVLFVVTRLGGGGVPTLTTLEQMSTPLDVALVNGRPTVVEFYANWCEVCRELVPDEYELEKRYQGKVNFVMLNIENSKWAPEASEFGVRGIPHFVFFDKAGEPQAMAVGRIPREVLDGNLDALTRDAPLPFGGVQGRTSAAAAPVGSAMAGPRQAMPRDHA